MSDKRIFGLDEGIDEELCLSMYDNSYDFYTLVLKTFLKEAKRNISELKDFYEKDDEEGYRLIVHSLKSSAASVGAMDYSNLASECNELIKAGKWNEAKKMNYQIIDELSALIMLIEIRLSAWEE